MNQHLKAVRRTANITVLSLHYCVMRSCYEATKVAYVVYN